MTSATAQPGRRPAGVRRASASSAVTSCTPARRSSWERASGPMRGALIGAVLFEGLAATADEAEASWLAGGAFTLGAVPPPRRRRADGGRRVTVDVDVRAARRGARTDASWCSLNEGLGKVLRYGAYSPDVDRAAALDDRRARPRSADAPPGPRGPIDIKAIVAQMIQMGDEGHNRNRAGTLMLLKEWLPDLITSGLDPADVAEVVRFVSGNDHFFLNLVMPACKLMTRPRAAYPGSTRGHDDGPQRHRLRHPGVGHRRRRGSPVRRRSPTASTSAATGPTTPTPTSATRRSPRRPASAGSRWRPRRRSSASSAGRSPTRSPPPAGCTTSASARTPAGRSRSWTSAARRPVST